MKRFLSAFLALILCAGLTVPALASGDDALPAARELNALGLFAGKGTLADGTPDFALGDQMNRMEAVTMLVRLLGKEQTALAEKNAHPFADVQAWADPYVGYCYVNGLTLGQGGDRFGGSDTVSAQQYSTFVLRALGYSSETDFSYADAESFAAAAGLTVEQGAFDRGSAAALSRSALSAALAGESRTLAAALTEQGAIDAAVCAELDIPMTAEKPDTPAFERGEYPLTDCTLSADALLADLPGAKWVITSNGNVDYYMADHSESEFTDRLRAAYLDSAAAYLAGRSPDADSALRRGGSVKLRLDQGSDAFVFVLDADFVLLAWGQCCGADSSVALSAPAFDAAAPLTALREALAASLEAEEISASATEPDEDGIRRVYLHGLGDARYYAAFLPLSSADPDEELRGTIISAVPDILYVQKVCILLGDGTRIPMYFGEMLIERDETGWYIPDTGTGSKLFLFYGDDGVIESWCRVTA